MSAGRIVAVSMASLLGFIMLGIAAVIAALISESKNGVAGYDELESEERGDS